MSSLILTEEFLGPKLWVCQEHLEISLENYIYITGDHHFGHNSILNFEARNRPFETIKHMDDYLIDNWNKIPNSRIHGPGFTSHIFHLGDFAITNRDRKKEIMNRLVGHKHLIAGNHDGTRTSMEEIGFRTFNRWLILRINFKETLGNSRYVLLVHDPNPYLKYPERHVKFDAILSAHVHGLWRIKQSYQSGPVALNVGVDVNELAPIKLATCINELMPFFNLEYQACCFSIVRRPRCSSPSAFVELINPPGMEDAQ